ncbi:bone marrow proteoglycan-like isoform X2 [Cygnus olor]|uniref:bone marrow proteoglycan-like isoform X2 n=1 Tax=Cygnus olor TaxID=8869 RepID=UPI001ADE0C3A|nr:bone marrow proteoglycan-like isoform X2 [Cygnus olor]
MALPGRKHCLLVLPGQCPTMQPCLLLALALLGTASARHLAAVTSEVAEPELEAEAEDVECPLEDETNALNITDPQSIRTFRYIIVRRCQNFHTAQRVCSRCYRGRLASIHSYRTNILLQCRARTRVNNGRVWIGAITVLWAAACSATGLTTAAGTTRTGCTATRWSRGASAPPSAPQMGAGGAQTAT